MSNERIFALSQENQEVGQTQEIEGNISVKKSVNVMTKGVWGERAGNTYRFGKIKNKINGLNGESVYIGLTYKKYEEKTDDNNRKIVVLKLVGQEQTVEFYKDELYKNFGVQSRSRGKGRKPRYVGCTDDEYKILKELLIPLLRDEKCFKIFKSSNPVKIKETLNILKQ